MSEDRLLQGDEDVEAHRKKNLTDEPASEDESDDVEAHRKKNATDEPPSDDASDDFEAHRKRA